MPRKPCSSSYAKASKHQRDGPNCVNGWQLSIHWHISVGGKGDALVPKHFRLSFKLSLDYLTDALVAGRLVPPRSDHSRSPGARWPRSSGRVGTRRVAI